MLINCEHKLLVNNEADMLHFGKMKSVKILHSFGMVCAQDLKRCMTVLHGSGMAQMTLVNCIEHFVPIGSSWVMNLF